MKKLTEKVVPTDDPINDELTSFMSEEAPDSKIIHSEEEQNDLAALKQQIKDDLTKHKETTGNDGDSILDTFSQLNSGGTRDLMDQLNDSDLGDDHLSEINGDETDDLDDILS